MPRSKRQLRKIATWNCRAGRPSRDVIRGLRRLIEDTDADVIALQEAQDYIQALRKAFPGWRVYAKHGWPESTNCVVMVRRRCPRGRHYGRGWGTVRVEAGWTYGPTGKRHPGRTWTWVRVDGVPILSLHRVPGKSGDNGISYLEEAHELREWFDEHDGPMVAIGDANEGPRDTRPNTLLAVSRKVKGQLIFDRDEPGIDYALARDLTGRFDRLDTYGSDHRAGLLTLT